MVRRNAGFIGTDGINAPDKPTGVSASGGVGGEASVSFTAPTDVGGSAITGFVATSNDGIGATGSASPITVTGLSNGTSYTFRVIAQNSFGFSAPSDASGSVSPAAASRLVVAGGHTSDNSIEYTTEGTSGTWSNFGDLTQARYKLTANCSSSTRAVFGGGEKSDGSISNILDYVTIASTGNATDFGDWQRISNAGSSNGTTGLFMGGSSNASYNVTSSVRKITIASTGDATTFGSLTQSRAGVAGATSTTRAVCAGGFSAGQGSRYNIIDYHSYTDGDFSDFGDLTAATFDIAGGSNNTRAIFAGGDTGSRTDTISYITIASTGNSVDFGDLTAATERPAIGSGRIYAIIQGGNPGADSTSYVVFSTLGNAIDFSGTTSVNRNQGHTIASNGHGGLS